MDADDLAVGEELGQGVQGDPIGGVVEGGNQDEAVGDVEVGVAGGQALAVEDDGDGHGQGHDAQRLAVLIACRLEPTKILRERLVVGVVTARLDHGHDGLRIDEPGEVVHVAVRVVAGDALAQPDDVADAQIIGEHLLQPRAVEARVAALDLAQQALLGGQQAAPAVDVDGASFHDDAAELVPARDPGYPQGVAQVSRDPPGNSVVVLVVRVLRPGIEPPVDQVDGPRQILLVLGFAAISAR